MKRFIIVIAFCLLFTSVLIQCDNKETEDTVDDFPDTPKDAEVEDEDDDDGEPKAARPIEKVLFKAPKVDNPYIALFFSSPSDLSHNLVVSQAKKDGVDAALAKYDGVWSVEVPSTSAIEEDFALVMKTKAKHHAVSAKLKKPFTFESNQLVVQYEVKFQEGVDCGGAYVKLLSDTKDLDLSQFNDKTPYTIMFGPDKCGMDYKLHFIFRHKHIKTGVPEEKHAKKPKGEIEKYFTDKKTHLYTLVLNTDNTFEIFVDQTLVNSGSLLEDMSPPINPAQEIDDPSDKKPEDWDERAKIADPESKKPDDWDETEPEKIVDTSATKPEGWLDDETLMIPDPAAVKPKDWDNEMDGEWEPAKIDNPKCKEAAGCGEWKPSKIANPKYKGKWSPTMIDNPSYKGIWKPRRINNPDYFEDKHPYKMMPFGAIGLELWSMTENIAFDNFLIAESKKEADDFAAQTFDIKKDMERRMDPASQSVIDSIREATSDKPWIWAVIVLVVALPLVLLIAYCCMRSSPSSSGAEHRKRTDEPSPDDEEDEEEDGGEENGEADHLAAGASSAAQGDHAAATTRRGKNNLEDDEEGDNSSEEDKAISSEKPTRKRKTRKE